MSSDQCKNDHLIALHEHFDSHIVLRDHIHGQTNDTNLYLCTFNDQ